VHFFADFRGLRGTALRRIWTALEKIRKELQRQSRFKTAPKAPTWTVLKKSGRNYSGEAAARRRQRPEGTIPDGVEKKDGITAVQQLQDGANSDGIGKKT